MRSEHPFAKSARGLFLAALFFAPPLIPVTAMAQTAAVTAPDPRAGDPEYQRMQRLFGEVRDLLEDAADTRARIGEESSVSTLFTRQLGYDARSRTDRLLSSAFDVVANAPVTQIQSEIRSRRRTIDTLLSTVARLREDRISAPLDAGLQGTFGLAKDRATIDDDIDDAHARIAANDMAIRDAKARFQDAMREAGTPVSAEEADLLLDSVTGQDVIRIAAAYDAARGVSQQLLGLLDASDEDLGTAKRYYAMHTALLAVLVHAQTTFIDKIDGEYLPKLDAIITDVRETRAETTSLLRQRNTERQREALEANIESQRIAFEAAEFYRQHLKDQRTEIAAARTEAVRELRIADNTLRTVDASFQLRSMMESATMSFEALQNLQSPGIERIFRNDQLRREFRELSDRLNAGS